MRYLLIALMLAGCSSPVATVATVPAKPKVYKPSELVAMKEKLPEGEVEITGQIYQAASVPKSLEERVMVMVEDRGIRTTEDHNHMMLVFESNGKTYSPKFVEWVDRVRLGYISNVRAKGVLKLIDGYVYLSQCEVID